MVPEITIGDASKVFEKFRKCLVALTPQETNMHSSRALAAVALAVTTATAAAACSSGSASGLGGIVAR